jgi:hypothetical protein
MVWKNEATGEPVISSTIIVVDANELTRLIYDRIPVVVDKADYQAMAEGRGRNRPGRGRSPARVAARSHASPSYSWLFSRHKDWWRIAACGTQAWRGHRAPHRESRGHAVPIEAPAQHFRKI